MGKRNWLAAGVAALALLWSADAGATVYVVGSTSNPGVVTKQVLSQTSDEIQVSFPTLVLHSGDELSFFSPALPKTFSEFGHTAPIDWLYAVPNVTSPAQYFGGILLDVTPDGLLGLYTYPGHQWTGGPSLIAGYYAAPTFSGAPPAGDGFTISSITIWGETVPEPEMWAMLVLGFAFVGFALRRRGRGSLRLV